MKPKLSDLILSVAAPEVGVEEKPRGSNRGPRVDEYQAATWLKREDWGAWCASFACWVVMIAMQRGAEAGCKYTFKRPRTAGAFDLEDWSLEQDGSTRTRRRPGTDIQPGDLLIFDFSHCGFATSAPDKNGNVKTIEGNTNPAGGREGYAVLRKTRNVSTIRSRIRFTV